MADLKVNEQAVMTEANNTLTKDAVMDIVSEEQLSAAQIGPNNIKNKVIAAIQTFIGKQQYAEFMQLINALFKVKQRQIEELLEEYKKDQTRNKPSLNNSLTVVSKKAINSKSLADLLHQSADFGKDLEAAIDGLQQTVQHFQAQHTAAAAQKANLVQQINQTTQALGGLNQQRQALLQQTKAQYNLAYINEYMQYNPNFAAAYPELVALFQGQQYVVPTTLPIMINGTLEEAPVVNNDMPMEYQYDDVAPVPEIDEDEFRKDSKLEAVLLAIREVALKLYGQTNSLENQHKNYENNLKDVNKVLEISEANFKQAALLIKVFMLLNNVIVTKASDAEIYDVIKQIKEITGSNLLDTDQKVDNSQLYKYNGMRNDMRLAPPLFPKSKRNLEEEEEQQNYKSDKVKKLQK